MVNTEVSAATICELASKVKAWAGIELDNKKGALVGARLHKRASTLKFNSIEEYLRAVLSGADHPERVFMLDALTTNKTSFFRESDHFKFLHEDVLKKFRRRGLRKLRIWSAGCSTGEEPLSVAMTLLDALGESSGVDIKILATDICTRVLDHARGGIYPESSVAGVPSRCLERYFEPVKGQAGKAYRVKPKVAGIIRWAQLNLMHRWPMKGPFDVIFCRNVMIYFERETQKALVRRFQNLLGAGDHLFTGHVEAFTSLRCGLTCVQPAVYRNDRAGIYSCNTP